MDYDTILTTLGYTVKGVLIWVILYIVITQIFSFITSLIIYIYLMIKSRAVILKDILSSHTKWQPEFKKEAWERLKTNFRDELLDLATNAKERQVSLKNTIKYKLMSADIAFFKETMVAKLVEQAFICDESFADYFTYTVDTVSSQKVAYITVSLEHFHAMISSVVAKIPANKEPLDRDPYKTRSLTKVVPVSIEKEADKKRARCDSMDASVAYTNKDDGTVISIESSMGGKSKQQDCDNESLSSIYSSLEGTQNRTNKLIVKFMNKTCTKHLKTASDRGVGIDIIILFLLFKYWSSSFTPILYGSKSVTLEMFTVVIESNCGAYINVDSRTGIKRKLLMGHICDLDGIPSFPTYVLDEDSIGVKYAEGVCRSKLPPLRKQSAVGSPI